MTATYCQWCGDILTLDAPSPRACTERHETAITEAEEALVLDAARHQPGGYPRLDVDADGTVWRVVDYDTRADVSATVVRLTAAGRLDANLTLTSAGRAWLAEVPS